MLLLHCTVVRVNSMIIVDGKGKFTCKTSLFYFQIYYLSVILITRIKVMIFNSINVFLNLVKLMQSIQDEKRERKNDYSTK